MAWNDDYQLSLDAQIYQDEIYKKVFNVKEINRYTREDNKILDIKYHIDVELKMNNDSILLGQEKALRPNFAKYNTFTMEFYQNRHTGEKGEFFNLGAQFYLHGYWNESYTGFSKWYIIKIFDFLNSLKNTTIEALIKNTRPSSGYASFFYINYDRIPEKFIYYKHTGDL